MLRVPGIGTIHGFCARSHAREICAGVAFFLSANRCTASTIGLFAARFSGLKRSNPARRSVFGSSVVRASNLSGQVAHPNRAPRHEADPQLLAGLKYAVPLWVSFHEGIFGLDGRHRLNSMRSADCSCARLRKTEVQDFPRLDEVFDRARHILDWHLRIDPVLVIEIDAVSLEALQRALDHLLDVLRTAIQSSRAFKIEPNLVAIATLSRKGASASPTRSSLV